MKFKKEYFSKKWLETLPPCENGYLKTQLINLIRNASVAPRYISEVFDELDRLIGETNHHLFIPVNSVRYKINENFDWSWYNDN